MTWLLLGVISGAVGYLSADVWLTPDRQRSPFDVDQLDRATLAIATATLYGALHLLT